MILSHFSRDTEITPRSVAQERAGYKPRGLWVSVDGEDDWPSWGQDNEFTIAPNRFRVELTDGPLLLASVDAILGFTDQYGTDRRTGVSDRQFVYDIDWPAVAADHPGVIIAPYQWSLRMANLTSWYYPWDCASGCIWDASVIAAVEPLFAPAEMEPSP